MLEDYRQKQPIIYKMLKKSIKNEEFSHAYLFETNGFVDSKQFIYAFVKSLLCPQKKLAQQNCDNCHQCEIIESGNFPELKVINPEGMWIKKEQLKELRKEFNEKAIIGNKRIYIINEAEKLGISSANSILKFLEEPEEGIIAILVTENIYNVIETIRSRCQIMRMIETSQKNQDIPTLQKLKNIIYRKKENSEELMSDEKTNEKIIKTIDFINYYENHHKDTILFMNKLFTDYIKTKEELTDSFEIMSLYYKDIINIKLNTNPEIFTKTKEIDNILETNTLNTLCNKLNIITKTKQNIKFNANTNLLLDKLIIDLEGGI